MIPVGEARILWKCVSDMEQHTEGFLNWTIGTLVPMPSWAPRGFCVPNIHEIIFARHYVRQYSWSIWRTIAILQPDTSDFKGNRTR